MFSGYSCFRKYLCSVSRDNDREPLLRQCEHNAQYTIEVSYFEESRLVTCLVSDVSLPVVIKAVIGSETVWNTVLLRRYVDTWRFLCYRDPLPKDRTFQRVTYITALVFVLHQGWDKSNPGSDVTSEFILLQGMSRFPIKWAIYSPQRMMLMMWWFECVIYNKVLYKYYINVYSLSLSQWRRM